MSDKPEPLPSWAHSRPWIGSAIRYELADELKGVAKVTAISSETVLDEDGNPATLHTAELTDLENGVKLTVSLTGP